MSSLTTPTRIARGPFVPVIDTKAPIDRLSTAPAYGGLHTPPQSAHESRRPSLQYSTLSDAPYSASSRSFPCSIPTTPVHGIQQASDGYMHSWSDAGNIHKDLPPNLESSCVTSHIMEPTLQAAFDGLPRRETVMVCSTPPFPPFAHNGDSQDYTFSVSSGLQQSESWRPAQEMMNEFGAQNVLLGSALFPAHPNPCTMATDTTARYAQLGNGLHHFNHYSALSVDGFPEYHGLPSCYQHPQVVVPSQLSPEDDFAQHGLPSYTSSDQNNESIASSFGSSYAAFHDYDVVSPPSPCDAYFAHSEDEGYLMVKAENSYSPVRGQSSRRFTAPTGLTTRQKKRRSRRLRKAGRNVPLHRHDLNYCVVQCEGKQCCLEPVEMTIASKKKPHGCATCGQSFDRSEHLKRHMGSHNPESDRKYPCPMCPTRKIGRPDNAGDHFKTHLRPKKKGKRNDHVEWPILRDAIWDGYEDKRVAKKLLDGLQRWIHAGMPDTSGANRRPC